MNQEMISRAIQSSKTCRKVAAYFAANPSAADTLKGIADFWVGAPVKQVQHELEKLQFAGVVTRVAKGPGVAAPIFMLAGSPEIREMLSRVA